MKKQTIKLNESQLRQMIKEALNELDWKTAVTAANKSRKLTHDKLADYGYQSFVEPHQKWGDETKEKQKKEIERRLKQSKNLSNFATDALRKKFGLQSYYNDHNGVGNEYPDLRDGDYGYDPRNSEQVYRVPKPWAPRLDDFEESPLTDMPQDFQDKAKELKDFQNGNYDYTTDKGWHLKESRLNKIIKESIKKVLNEGFGGEQHRTNITCYGLNLEMSMNGEDIIVEYTDDNMWVLAIYCANDKTWHVQENLDNYSINNDEENIIDIGDTKSMPEALFNLSTYVRNKKNNIRM